MRECRKRLPLCFGIWCHLLARASTNQNTHSEVACPDLRYPPNVRAQPISVTSLAHTVRWTFRLLCCSKVTAQVNDWNLSAVLSYKPIPQHTFAGIANHAVLFIYKPKPVVTFNLSNFHALVPLTFSFPCAILVLRSLAWKRSQKMHMARIDGCFQTAFFTLPCMLPGAVLNFLLDRKPLSFWLWFMCVYS